MPKSKRKTSPPREREAQPTQWPDDFYEGLPVGVAIVGASGRLNYSNQCFRDILQISPLASVVGSDLKRYISTSSWVDLNKGLLAARTGVVSGEIRLEAAGRLHFVTIAMSPIRYDSSPAIRVVVAERTELVETSKALYESQAEISSLSAKVLALRDEERRRIARDLHDVTGQELAFVSLTLNGILAHGNQSEPAQQQINEAIGYLTKIQRDVRTLSYLLHPPMLDEIGLLAALQWYVGGLEKRSGLHVRLDIRDPLPRQPHDHEIALFRVVQESLTNVLRHAQAQNVWIRASVSSEKIQVYVIDDGVGVDPAKLTGPSNDSGVGIAGMDQRLRQFGGGLTVSRGDPGTQVCATVPLVEMSPEDYHEDTPHAANGNLSAEPPLPPKRILVADDHEITRRGIRAILEEHPDLEICGEVANGMDAILACVRLKPDLLILDVSMPEVGGFAVANRLQHDGLGTKILMFTTHSYPGIERTIRAAGCEGYVIKHNAGQELVKAIRTILDGGTHFSQTLQAASN